MRVLLFILLLVSARATDIYPVAASGSMKPLFDENYFLFVEHPPFHDLKVGDIIIYRTHYPFVFDKQTYYTIVHKIYRRSSGGSIVLCWGVNNPEPDSEFITEDMYVGKVVRWVTREEYFKPTFTWR